MILVTTLLESIDLSLLNKSVMLLCKFQVLKIVLPESSFSGGLMSHLDQYYAHVQ